MESEESTTNTSEKSSLKKSNLRKRIFFMCEDDGNTELKKVRTEIWELKKNYLICKINMKNLKRKYCKMK